MNYLTFGNSHSEKHEKAPSGLVLRVQKFTKGVANIEYAVQSQLMYKQQRKEERYGKYAVQAPLFTSEWDNFHKQRAAQAIIDQVIPERIKNTVTAAPKETILDAEITIDPSQFDAIANEQKADLIENELQAMITDEYSKETDGLGIDKLLQQAEESAVPAKESYERITKITL